MELSEIQDAAADYNIKPNHLIRALGASCHGELPILTVVTHTRPGYRLVCARQAVTAASWPSH
eukprot:3554918-Rhodomonas_salina.1